MPLVRKPGQGANKPQQVDAAATVNALRHGTADERWAAARAAAQLPDGDAALAAALPQESDARVREAMLTSLARIGSPQSVAAIIPLLRLDDAGVRTSALDALRAMPDAVRAYVPQLLADNDRDVRILSCEIVRSLPGDTATQLLGELLARESDVNVCAAAVEVLAEVGGPGALAALDQLAAHHPDEVFLAFSIRIARERILAQPATTRG